MAQKIVWSPLAVVDLSDIVKFIAKDSPRYAEEFLREAEASASYLIPFPRRGRIVPELAQSNIREVLISNYRLIYQIFENTILVLALVHGARDLLGFWRKRL